MLSNRAGALKTRFPSSSFLWVSGRLRHPGYATVPQHAFGKASVGLSNIKQ